MKVFIKFAVVAVFFCFNFACSSMFSGALIHPNRQDVIKNPADYGMEYKDVEFQTPDDITISGWFIPGNSEYIAIMVPPMNFSKYGYSIEHQGAFRITEIEVEFLKTARNLHDAGYDVLIFDLRNHGESEDHPGNLFALGNYEYNDVLGALNFIEADDTLKLKKHVFVSFCTGANATFLAMKKEPHKFSKTKCMAAIQPISTEVFVTNFMDDQYSMFSWLIPGMEQDIINATSYSFDDLTPMNYIDGLMVPALFVQAKEDKWTDYTFVEELYNRAPVEKQLVLFEGDMHRFDTYNYFGHSPEILLEFLERYK